MREYALAEKEEKPDEYKEPGAYADDETLAMPEDWPRSGEVEFRDVTIKYDTDGPEILKNVNLKFAAGERVAVVGRTGSGKSTVSHTVHYLSSFQRVDIYLLRSSWCCPCCALPTLYPERSSLMGLTLRAFLADGYVKP